MELAMQRMVKEREEEEERKEKEDIKEEIMVRKRDE